VRLYIESLEQGIAAADALATGLLGSDVAKCWSPRTCQGIRRTRARAVAPVEAHRLNDLCAPCQAHAHAGEVQRLLYVIKKHGGGVGDLEAT